MRAILFPRSYSLACGEHDFNVNIIFAARAFMFSILLGQVQCPNCQKMAMNLSQIKSHSVSFLLHLYQGLGLVTFETMDGEIWIHRRKTK